MVYTKSAFEMPDGKYLAKFLGCTLRELQPGEQPKIGVDGKPMPPAMTWDFEIVDGPERGKKTDKLTGRVPTPKSGCGKMLAAIADTVLKDGVEVDIAHFVGMSYRVTVVDNRVQDSPPPSRVYDHNPATGQVVTGSQPSQLTASGAPIVGPVPDLNARWDYRDDDTKVANATTAEVHHLFATSGIDPKRILVKPAGAPVEQAKTADLWGFGTKQANDTIPW